MIENLLVIRLRRSTLAIKHLRFNRVSYLKIGKEIGCKRLAIRTYFKILSFKRFSGGTRRIWPPKRFIE